MKKVITTVICTFTSVLTLYSQAPQIGHTTIDFIDHSRNDRVIQTEIYYPALSAGDEADAIQGNYPVIVFGHGFVMAWDAYQNIWEEFVSKGYIIAFPRTEGNAFNTDHQRFGWDLQFLVGRMQEESVDANSILYNTMAPETALMGHSMGGGASFLAADSLCVNGNVNLKTIVGLAPAESTSNGVSSINSSKSITVPALILSGSNDGVTPPDEHHIPMYDSLASDCKTFISINGGAHCYFAQSNFNCDFGEGSASNGISITREEQQDITYNFLTEWLDYTLKGNCESFDNYNDSLTNSTRITFNQECVINPVPAISLNSGQLISSETGISYEWFLNGNAIPNSNNINYAPAQSGNYTVEVTYQNGCSEVSDAFEVILTGVGIQQKTFFKIYPNPAQNFVIVEGVDLNQVELFNLKGQKMTVSFNDTKIDLNSIPSGIYLLKVNEVVRKLIVE